MCNFTIKHLLMHILTPDRFVKNFRIATANNTHNGIDACHNENKGCLNGHHKFPGAFLVGLTVK